jgi:hypothetical protein
LWPDASELNHRVRARRSAGSIVTNISPSQIVNCAPSIRFRDGLELRIVPGVLCPQCVALGAEVPIRAFDARRFDDGGLFILCREGHDFLRLERNP